MRDDNQLGQMWPDVLPHDSIVAKPKIVYLYNGSAAAWVAGDVLDLDLAVTTWGISSAAKQHAAAASGLEVGIALEATAIGEKGPVQVAGDYGDFSADGTADDGANVLDATVAGALLTGSAATAGRLTTLPAAHAATTRVVAIALEDGNGNNKARIRLLNPMGL